MVFTQMAAEAQSPALLKSGGTSRLPRPSSPYTIGMLSAQAIPAPGDVATLDLLDAVNVGLARDRVRRENEVTLSALRARFEVLTSRERAVLTRQDEL